MPRVDEKAATSSVLLAASSGIAALQLGWGAAIVIAATTGIGNYVLAAPRTLLDDEKVKFALGGVCARAMSDLRKIDPHARLNVMLIRGVLRRRFDFFQKFHMEGAADEDLYLRAHQGAAGLAVRKQTWVVADLQNGTCNVGDQTVYKKPNFRLDAAQLEATKELTRVYCFPIFRLKRQKGTSDLVTTKTVLGVVNLDTTTANAATLYDPNTHERALLQQTLPDLARYAGFLLS